VIIRDHFASVLVLNIFVITKEVFVVDELVLSHENLRLIIELLTMGHMQIDFMLSFDEFKSDLENLHHHVFRNLYFRGLV
jgi:hypothetical protein